MSPVTTTTLNAIREHQPCESGWRKLLAHLGKTKADDEPLLLTDVLDSNGLDDALWCLRTLGPKYHGWVRHFAVDCAEDVKHLMTEQHSLAALEVARRYADGLATDDELAAAEDAAWAATSSAAVAAARAATSSAAVAAAWAAAEAAAEAAAGGARAAARAKQTDRLRAYLNKGGRP